MDRGADDLTALPASRRNLATKVQGTGRICRHLPVFLPVMFHVEQAGRGVVAWPLLRFTATEYAHGSRGTSCA
ncbi:hypothetical protein G6F50_018544 [Rhizopus delemar]|uniref:Uncharacterized protein n=1 Tax=Rhizopus delemar TaxID=936053 RepID=A0A9P7BY68_9FUNG|nr:hypothetical protein G6F50_018544 [Rhizopus delemar]